MKTETEAAKAAALARRSKLLERGIADVEAYKKANRQAIYPQLRAEARRNYAEKILVEQGRSVRQYIRLDELTPEQKTAHKREQARERMQQKRARDKIV